MTIPRDAGLSGWEYGLAFGALALGVWFGIRRAPHRYAAADAERLISIHPKDWYTKTSSGLPKGGSVHEQTA